MSLATEFEHRSLDLEFPFRIARGTTETTDVVVVRITDGDHVGIGSASPSTHYGETVDTVLAVLPDLLEVVRSVGDPAHLDRIERRLREVVRGNPAAQCAVSIALHDLVCKRRSIPLYRYWGLDPSESVRTSYTVGIADPETMADRAELAVDRGSDVLKVKLGTDDDLARIEAVRKAAPDARIRVDANEAWTPREAVRMIDRLDEYGIEFVEQPVPADDPEGLQFVYEHGALPIAADESCLVASDVPTIASRCDIVTLKLMKTGGLREAVRAIHTARAHGLEVMLGCMTESNASIAAACHLAPLLDYADLDGSLLLDDDPYEGVPFDGSYVGLDAIDRSGTGVRPRE